MKAGISAGRAMAVIRIGALMSGEVTSGGVMSAVATTGEPRSGGPMRVALKSGGASRAASTRLGSRGRVARTTAVVNHVATSAARMLACPKRSVLPARIGQSGQSGQSARSARRRPPKRLAAGL